MKILRIFLNAPPFKGGAENRIHEISKVLAKKHKITVLTGGIPEGKEKVVDGIRYIYFGDMNIFTGFKNDSLSEMIKWLIDVSRYIFFKNINIKRFEGTYLRAMADWLNKNGKDYDIIINEFTPGAIRPISNYPYSLNVIHLRYSLFDTFEKSTKFGWKFNWLEVPYYYLFQQFLFLTNKNFIVCKTDDANAIHFLNKNAKIKVIHPAADPSLRKAKTEEKNFILYMGRIDKYQKGLDLLLEAFAELNCKEKLVVAGDGYDLLELKEKVKDLDIKNRVKFVGWVAGNSKRKLLTKCKFVVMPSRIEGLSLTSLEAAYCGKAILGTNAVAHGLPNVYLIELNKQDIYRGLITLLNNSKLRKKLGNKGRKAANKFSWESSAGLEEVYYAALRK